MHTPVDIQLIGSEVAIRWVDGAEGFISMATLRANSPSAQTRGERDIFGHQYGGEAPQNYVGVEATGWERIGNYATLVGRENTALLRDQNSPATALMRRPLPALMPSAPLQAPRLLS